MRRFAAIIACLTCWSCSDDEARPNLPTEPAVDLAVADSDSDAALRSDTDEPDQGCVDCQPVCEIPNAASPDYELVQTSRFTFTAPDGFEVRALPFGDEVALTFDRPEISGFVISQTVATQDPSAALLTLEYADIGEVSNEVFGNEFPVGQHGRAASRAAFVALSEAATPADVRNQALELIAPELQVAPALGESAQTDLGLHTTAIIRDNMLFTVFVATPADSTDETRQWIDDFIFARALSFDSSTPAQFCQTQLVRDPRARLEAIWLVDARDSLDDDIARIREAIPAFFELLGTSYHPRLAIVAMQQVAEPDALVWHREPAAAQTALDELQRGDGYGLQAAQSLIENLSGEDAPAETAFRCGSTTSTFFFSDRAPASLVDISPDPSNTARAEASAEYQQFFRRNSISVSVTPGPECLEEGVDEYDEVAIASGGQVFSLCEFDADAIRGLTSFLVSVDPVEMRPAPIPASIRITKNGEELERSGENGFVYAAQTNTLQFLGDAQSTSRECDGTEADRYEIVYDYFER